MIDVETLNQVTALLMKEIMKYPAGSKEALALWKFKELLEVT